MDPELIYLVAVLAIALAVSLIKNYLDHGKLVLNEFTIEDLREGIDFAEDFIQKIKDFYNPQTPDITDEDVVRELPAASYKMSPENLQIVLATCLDETERMNVIDFVAAQETYTATGDMIVDYYLTTHGKNGGKWHVQYGIPVLESPKSNDYKYLTQAQKLAIIDLSTSTNVFKVMDCIAEAEKNLVTDYFIEGVPEFKIHVINGEWRAES